MPLASNSSARCRRWNTPNNLSEYFMSKPTPLSVPGIRYASFESISDLVAGGGKEQVGSAERPDLRSQGLVRDRKELPFGNQMQLPHRKSKTSDSMQLPRAGENKFTNNVVILDTPRSKKGLCYSARFRLCQRLWHVLKRYMPCLSSPDCDPLVPPLSTAQRGRQEG
jgi:hypothetical protein